MWHPLESSGRPAMPERLLVVGNGMAGLRFVEELLERAPEKFAVTVIGKEPEPAYNRVLLSAVLAGDLTRDDASLRPLSWYEDQGVSLVTGDPVVSIDVAGRSAMLGSGRTLTWHRLVFATGSSAIRLPLPGMDLPGVATFRGLRRFGHARASSTRRVGGGDRWRIARFGGRVWALQTRRQGNLDPPDGPTHGASTQRARRESATRGRRGTGHPRAAGGIYGGHRRPGVRRGRPSRRRPYHPGRPGCLCRGHPAGNHFGRRRPVSPAGAPIQVDDTLATSVDGVHAVGECAEHDGTCYGLVEPAYEQARVLADYLAGNDPSPLHRFGGGDQSQGFWGQLVFGR